MKKKIVLSIIIIIAFVVIFLIGKQLVWNYKVAHAKKIVELSTDKVLVYQSGIKLNMLIKEINGKMTTNPVIDTSKVGKQKISFNYTTDEGYPVSYEVEIEVVDVTPPIVFRTKKKTIYSDFEGDLAKEYFCGDNYDPNPIASIEGEYNIHEVGEYDLLFVCRDQSGNKASNSFTLNVKKRPSSSGGGSSASNYLDFQDLRNDYAGEGVTFGIDVSHWQGDINFKKVKAAGVDFAYIRVGRGNGIGKEYVLDDKFERNIKGFNEVGIPVGVYFYSNANSRKDAEKEANWIINKIKNYKVDLEIVYDWENWDDFQSYDLSFHELKESYQAFRKAVEKKGYKAMLYGSKSYLESIWDSPAQPWLAHYAKETSYAGKYKVWQISDSGKVNGIYGAVDLDIRYE